MILSEVLDERPSISWDGIAGLHKAKQALQVAAPHGAWEYEHWTRSDIVFNGNLYLNVYA